MKLKTRTNKLPCNQVLIWIKKFHQIIVIYCFNFYAVWLGVIEKSPSITKDQIELSDAECPALEDRGSPSPEPQNAAVIEDEPEGPVKFFQPPEGSFTTKLYWYVMWLGNLVFFLTIPDVRRGKKWRRTYPLAFFICILWIGTLSYLVAWFITVIGTLLVAWICCQMLT